LWAMLKSANLFEEKTMRLLISLLLMLLAAPLAAQNWSEPPRGSVLRATLMDAVRPHAEWNLGAPVEFEVLELRHSGDVAFASLWAQRPGGQQIDMTKTPMYQRGDIDPEIADGATLQVLYRKSGVTWVAVHWAIGATDVWFAYGPLCREYKDVI